MEIQRVSLVDQYLHFLSETLVSPNLLLITATLLDKHISTTCKSFHLQLETFVQVKTDHVHKILPHVPHKFYRVLGQDKPGMSLSIVIQQNLGHPNYTQHAPLVKVPEKIKLCLPIDLVINILNMPFFHSLSFCTRLVASTKINMLVLILDCLSHIF